MRKIALLVVAVVFTTGLMAQNTEAKQQSKTGNEPEITFESLEHDFGTIYKGSDAKFDFVFKNIGKEDLVLSRVQPSCGCTAADYTKEPVKKKGVGKISVGYNTNSMGRFEKTITVESNAINNSVKLTIKGQVIEAPEEAVPQNTQSPIVTPQ